MRLSVIVITHNESANLRACLASVAFADETIVVDSGSTDDTVAIARDCGAQVLQTPDWPGFGAQKNRALALATGDWVLSIDADERVTQVLAARIRTVVAQDEADAYEIPRLTRFCGSGSTIAAGRPITCCGCSGVAGPVSVTIWSMSACCWRVRGHGGWTRRCYMKATPRLLTTGVSLKPIARRGHANAMRRGRPPPCGAPPYRGRRRLSEAMCFGSGFWMAPWDLPCVPCRLRPPLASTSPCIV